MVDPTDSEGMRAVLDAMRPLAGDAGDAAAAGGD
jgi:hypothetical protein